MLFDTLKGAEPASQFLLSLIVILVQFLRKRRSLFRHGFFSTDRLQDGIIIFHILGEVDLLGRGVGRDRRFALVAARRQEGTQRSTRFDGLFFVLGIEDRLSRLLTLDKLGDATFGQLPSGVVFLQLRMNVTPVRFLYCDQSSTTRYYESWFHIEKRKERRSVRYGMTV